MAALKQNFSGRKMKNILTRIYADQTQMRADLKLSATICVISAIIYVAMLFFATGARAADIVLYDITVKDSCMAISSPELASPDYADYYKNIRDKIRNRVIARYRSFMNEGDVFVAFVLDSAGRVDSVLVEESGSTRDAGLRTLCLDSVRQSAPFPPFPKALSRPRMSFNVQISFRRE